MLALSLRECLSDARHSQHSTGSLLQSMRFHLESNMKSIRLHLEVRPCFLGYFYKRPSHREAIDKAKPGKEDCSHRQVLWDCGLLLKFAEILRAALSY